MQFLYLLCGLSSLVLGALLLPTPIPFGVPLLALGSALILTGSPGSRAWFKRWRTRHPRASDTLLKYETRLPLWLQNALAETRPDEM